MTMMPTGSLLWQAAPPADRRNNAVSPRFRGEGASPSAGSLSSVPKDIISENPYQPAPRLRPPLIKPQYGRFQNNARELIRVGLMNVLPLALTLLPLAGLPGFLMSMALLPFIYIAGRVGRYIGKDVNPENLMSGLKFFRKLHALLNPTLTSQEKRIIQERLRQAATPEERKVILQEFQNRDHAGKINEALTDFIASAKLPKVLSSFVQNDQFRTWLLNLFRIDGSTRFGAVLNKLINNQTLFRSQVFSEIANSESMGQAAGKGIKGLWNSLVDFTLMPWIGEAVNQLAASPLCPVFLKPILRGLGETCKNWFVAKSAWDAAHLFQSAK